LPATATVHCYWRLAAPKLCCTLRQRARQRLANFFVLSEWIDFFFVPTPKRFVIYADHDEYITFLAHRKGQLSVIVEALNGAKFRAVEYVRKL